MKHRKIYVEKLKFGTPVEKEYLKQKVKTAECRHLKGIEYIMKCDATYDYCEYIPYCKKCGKSLGIIEVQKIREILDKFRNNKK